MFTEHFIQHGHCKCKSSYSLGKVHCLNALAPNLKVAAWLRNLDTSPWRWEESRRIHTCKEVSVPLCTARASPQNARAITSNARTVYAFRARVAQLELWVCMQAYAQATHKSAKKLYHIGRLAVENCRGGTKEVEQALSTDSYGRKGAGTLPPNPEAWKSRVCSSCDFYQYLFWWINSMINRDMEL